MLCSIICREVSGTKRDRKDPDIVCLRRRQPLSHLVQFAHQRSRLSLSFAFFLHFLHLYINSLQHFSFSALLLTDAITASLFITQIANKLCALCEEQATEDVRFLEWGACARFWASTYKAVKTQPVQSKGQLSVN